MKENTQKPALYPLLFEQVAKEYLWGGNQLSSYGKIVPESGILAESWELSSHPDGESIVKDGALKGYSLSKLVAEYSTDLMGTDLPADKIEKFPLLIKFIDAKSSLSVQVHPNDEFAAKHEGPHELGKTEMWYIMKAEPGAKLVCGLKSGVTHDSFAKAVEDGCIGDCLGEIEVNAGDFINIPAGMVHAIGEGILLCEVQQNSNTTYRVYDFDRVDANGNKRELHIEKALGAIQFNDINDVSSLVKGLKIDLDKNAKTILVANEFFAVERYELCDQLAEVADGSRFCSYTILDGECSLTYAGVSYALKAGTTVMIPASLGEYTINVVSEKATALKAYVPDIEKNIFAPLMAAGYSRDDIEKNVSLS